MSSRSSYSRFSRRPVSAYRPRSLAPRRSTIVSGRGAYVRRSYQPRIYRRPVLKGRGAYYAQIGAYGQGQLGPFKGGGAIHAGYSQGNTVIPKLSGLGAYSVSNIKHNVLIKPDIPEVRNSVYVEGGTIIRHREYLGPIITSSTAGAFKISTYPLNPAQMRTFPWLSAAAANFEEYKPNGVMFEFRSTASDAIASSTNLALGQVMMCTQYDPTDPVFTDDVALLNYSWAQSGKVSDNICHYVECDPKQSPLSHLYTRSQSATDDSDLRFSDFGNFSIATSGLQGTSVQVGQLWVTYEFILYKPKLGDQNPGGGGYFHALSDDGSCTHLKPAGDIATWVLDPSNNISPTFTNDAFGDFKIVFPVLPYDATYKVTLVWNGDTTVSCAVPGVTFTNCTATDNFTMPTMPYILFPNVPSTQQRCLITTWVAVPRDVSISYITLTNTKPPDNSTSDLYIDQLPFLNPAIYNEEMIP